MPRKRVCINNNDKFSSKDSHQEQQAGFDGDTFKTNYAKNNGIKAPQTYAELALVEGYGVNRLKQQKEEESDN